MPTCSKGEVTKTATGTVKIMYHDVTIKTVDLNGETVTDRWDNCKCEEGKYKEIKCITAEVKENKVPEKGTYALGKSGFSIDYDLKVDSIRKITNCEYECKPEAY